MIGNLNLEMILGKKAAGSQICFHPSRSQLFTPVSNKISCFDFDKNTNRTLSLSSRSMIVRISIDPTGRILLCTDRENRMTAYDLVSQAVIGEMHFERYVSSIVFSANGMFFCVANGRYVHIYETPLSGSGIVLEPFLLLRKFNSKAAEQVEFLRLDDTGSIMMYSGEDRVVRLTPTFGVGKSTGARAKTFELLGHKGPIIDVDEQLETSGVLSSVDSTGRLLVWQLVQSEKTGESEGKRVKTSNNSDSNMVIDDEVADDFGQAADVRLSSLELKFLKSKFILRSKHSIFREGKRLNVALFSRGQLMCGFTDGSFTLQAFSPLSETEQLKDMVSFRMTEAGPTALVLHPFRSILGSAYSDGRLSVWDYRTKTFLLNQTGVSSKVTDISYSPDGKFIAVGQDCGALKVFEVASSFCHAVFTDALASISAVCFSTPTTLLSASLDGNVRAYDLNRRLKFRDIASPSGGQILCMKSDPESEFIFCGCSNPFEVVVYSLRTGEVLERVAGHDGYIHKLLYCSQLQLILSASWDRTVRMISLTDRRRAADSLPFTDRVITMTLSADEKTVAVCTSRQEVSLFSMPDLQPVGLIDLGHYFGQKEGGVLDLEFSRDSKSLLVVGRNSRMVQVDIPHRSVVDQLELTRNRDYKYADQKLNSKHVVDGQSRSPEVLSFEAERLAVSPDGRNIAVGCSEGLLVFGPPLQRAVWRFSTEVTEASLLKMIEEQRHVDFVIVCLKHGMTDLVESVLDRVQESEIVAIIRVVVCDPQLFALLLESLVATFEQSTHVTYLGFWLRTLLGMCDSEVRLSDNRHHVRGLYTIIEEKLHPLLESCLEARSLVSFIQNQNDRFGPKATQPAPSPKKSTSV